MGKLTLSAKLRWLFVFYNILILAPVCAQEKSISGGYVDDDAISVPANAYVTFSTVYGGKRYYLGVDTIAAKADTPKDTVAYYESPNYATMWIAGPLWSPTGEKLDNKDYTRTIKNVWTSERVSRDLYLGKGAGKAGYTPLILVNEAGATMWHTAKDMTSQGQYIQGFLYDYSDESGVDVYRYLTYDPLYGFSRLYESRPSESQRISVWDRKRGNDVTCTLTPSGHIFGLNTTDDTTRLPITSHVYYYTGMDRFRSRYDQVDVYVTAATVYDDQQGLIEPPYEMFGFYEWASNPRPTLPTSKAQLEGQTYSGHSLMPVYVDSINHHSSANPEDWTLVPYWGDSAVLWVSDKKYKLEDNVFYDTIFAIGKSPFDRPGECRVLRKVDDNTPPVEGDYTPHMDWLRQHFYIKNPATRLYEHFADSVHIVRRTFHNAPYTTLSTTSTPNDTVHDYSTTAVTMDFEISATYESGKNILYANNTIAQKDIEEQGDLNLTELTPYTINDTLYNGLIVEALLIDGTSAIGDGDEQWIQSVSVPSLNVIRVVAKPMTESDLRNRMAQIRFTYRYRHSSARGDWSENTRSIWITQKGYSSTSASVYDFNHKDGESHLQATHEKIQTYYAIPGQDFQLLLHRDYWGYYRWFIYDEDKLEKDLLYGGTWSWASQPKNALGTSFMEINHTTDASSRGRWDIMKDIKNPGNTHFASDHFNTAEATSIPLINYPNSNSKKGKVACEVSAYYDVDVTGEIGATLTAMTEPTLSYRQIIDILPAKEQADTMAKYRYLGDDPETWNPDWMERHNVVVPAGCPFSLTQRYPVIAGSSDVIQRDHLQYIYYFNTSEMGRKGSLDDTKAASFSRVGEKRTVSRPKRLKLLTKKDLNDMTEGQTKKVILVNPRKATGYAVGRTGNEDIATLDWTSQGRTVNDTAALRAYLMTNRVLGNDRCEIKLTKSATQGYFTLSQNNYPLYSYVKISWTLYEYVMKWISGNERDVTGGKLIRYDDFSNCTDGDRVTGCNYAKDGNNVADSCTLFKLHMQWSRTFSRDGFITACDWGYHWTTTQHYEPDFNVVDGGGNSGSSAVNQGWMIYEILEAESTDYEEIPRWEKSANGISGWMEVAREGTITSNYQMLDDGNLRISENTHTTANETIFYRLRTEHFQLAKFAVVIRDRAKDGPSTSAIISEDSLQNNFDILYTLGNETFLPVPGTTDVKAYDHSLPWSITDLSYHYPRTVIPDEKRVFATDLPAAGEYAYLNKFTLNGHTTEAMAGAENGYMLCIHAAQKPETIFDFTYPQLPCSDQDIYLTFNLCNPLPGTGYRPQVTAELQGKIGNGEWKPLHRFKTGELNYEEGKWQQFVLDIPQSSIKDQDYFRCVATLTGSTVDDAYLLIDRLRFISKERPVNIFQNKVSCLERDGSGVVDIIARLDYKNATFPAGTNFAYQYQKKVGDEFVPLQTAAEGGGEHAVKYANDLGSFQMQDKNDKSCGVITMPAKDYTPTGPGDTIVLPGGITTHLKTYVNEGTAEHAYYVMYISEPVYAHAGDTFRVAMTTISGASDKPNFANAGCAMERLIPIHNPVELHVNNDETEWTNYTREQIDANPDDDKVAVLANATYTVTAQIGDAFLPSDKLSGSGKCMFDVVRTMADDRGYGADEWFKKRFGVDRALFRDIMTIFRADDDRNPMRLETNWNNVRPEMFQYSGRSKQQADSMYTILNRLIVDSAFIEIGKSSYDIYLGENNNAYVVLWPIPASGQYVDATTYDIKQVSVCSTPRWFEIHSEVSAPASLRFGYDNMFEGDYYILPVVRASSTDANSSLEVRVAEITHNETTVAVMGWEATTVVETNDPTWGESVFKYQQDKDVRGQNPIDYYQVDEKVTFTPVAGNTGTLKAGYWYKFRVPYYAASVGGVFSETTPVGHADFVLAVAPDTVRWTPSHPWQTNYWNDDNNWQPVMAKTPADGFKARVPMNKTKVIIPQTEEGLLPVVSDLVVNYQDERDYGYQKNTCQQILFLPRSQMLGQEKLEYERAFIDVPMKTGSWQTFSPALTEIYSGDLYIPYASTYNKSVPGSGASVDTVDFAPKPFATAGAGPWNYNPRVYPFAFYQGYYNSSVSVAYNNTDIDGWPVATTVHQSKNSADWVKTNLIDTLYHPGGACVITGFDETNNNGNEIVVRLPKPDEAYYTFSKSGSNYIRSSAPRAVAKTSGKNLAYDKTRLGAADGITYTLHNAMESEIFFFGNPTMALIDVYQLCKDNKDVLFYTGSAGSEEFKFTAYQLIDGETSSYTVKDITGPGQYFVAPQRAVGLIADNTHKVSKTLPIKLTPKALVALTGEGIVVSHEDVKTPGELRKMRMANSQAAPVNPRRLYISASNETDDGLKKAYLTLGEQPDASRGFRKGEDALSLSSGLHYFSYSSFSTPISMYTIADNEALMMDIRDTITRVPLVFATLDEKFEINNRTLLSFSMQGDWSTPLYLYDVLTNDSVLILNGLQVAIETPMSDQIRYFINGYNRLLSSEEQHDTPTDVEEVNDQSSINNDQSVTAIYDILGRKIMTLNEYDLISNIQLPTGVYIIQRGNNTERMVIR